MESSRHACRQYRPPPALRHLLSFAAGGSKLERARRTASADTHGDRLRLPLRFATGLRRLTRRLTSANRLFRVAGTLSMRPMACEKDCDKAPTTASSPVRAS